MGGVRRSWSRDFGTRAGDDVVLEKSARAWPRSAKLGRNRPNRPRFGPVRPNFGRHRPELGRNNGRRWSNLDHSWRRPTQRPNSAELGRSLAPQSTKLVVWVNFSRNLSKVGPTRSNFGRTPPQFGRKSPNARASPCTCVVMTAFLERRRVAERLQQPERYRTFSRREFPQITPSDAGELHSRPKVGEQLVVQQLLMKPRLGPKSARSGRFGPTFARCGPCVAKLAKFDQNRPNAAKV